MRRVVFGVAIGEVARDVTGVTITAPKRQHRSGGETDTTQLQMWLEDIVQEVEEVKNRHRAGGSGG